MEQRRNNGKVLLSGISSQSNKLLVWASHQRGLDQLGVDIGILWCFGHL